MTTIDQIKRCIWICGQRFSETERRESAMALGMLDHMPSPQRELPIGKPEVEL